MSKQEVHIELGLRPAEFLEWLVRDAGGRMWQGDLVETTGWSGSSVSRYLGRLESEGAVDRVRIGRRKLVGVPGGMPDSVPTPDGPAPDHSTSSWSSEVESPA